MGDSRASGKMKHHKAIHSEDRIIECTVEGIVDLRALAEIGKECRIYALQHNFRFLLNVSQSIGLPDLKVASDFFRMYYRGLEHGLKVVTTALVSSQDYFDTLTQIETDWNDQGANVKAFKDRDEAYAWLRDAR